MHLVKFYILSDKNIEQIRYLRNVANIMITYSKPIANIKFNGKIVNTFRLRSGTKHGLLLSTFSLKVVLEILSRTTKQVKKYR